MEHGENGESPEPHDKSEDAEHNLNGTHEVRLDEEDIENAVPDVEFPENGNQPESAEEKEEEPHSDGGRKGEPEGSERDVENPSEEDIENAVPDVEFSENENLPLEGSEGEPFSDADGIGEGEPEVSEEDIENAVPDVEFPQNGDQPKVSEDMEGEFHSDGEREGNQSEPSKGMEGEKRSDGEREGEPEDGENNIENSVPGGQFIEIGDQGPPENPEDPEETPSPGLGFRSGGGYVHNPVTTIGSRWEGESIRDGLKEEYKGESVHVREIKEREEDVRKLLENMERDSVEKDVRRELENKLRENLGKSGFGKKEIDKIVEQMIREIVEERMNELLGRTTSSEVRSGSGSYGDNSFLSAFFGALNFLAEGVSSFFGKVFSSAEKLVKASSSQSGLRRQNEGEPKFHGWGSEKQGAFKAERQGGEQGRLNKLEQRAEKVEINNPVEKGGRVESHEGERHNVEKTFKPEVEVRYSAQTGRVEPPEGGWKQYATDSTRIQKESSRTSFEKTRTISQGETPEGVRVKEITGNSEAYNIRVRIPIDGKQFEDFWLNIRSLEQISRMETERPMEVSLRKELKGDNIKSKVWFHSDPRWKDLREKGEIRERWKDVKGVEYARIGRWSVFSYDVEGKNVAIGCIDVKEVGAGREGIDRNPDFKWFNPQPREQPEGMSGGESKTSIKGSSETRGTRQWMERLFREDNTQKYDYKVKLDITEVRYSPSGEAGSVAKAAETSSVAETFEKLFEQKAVEAERKTEAPLEKNARTSTVAETSKEVGEKSAYDNIEKIASASNIIRTPEIPAEKKFETSNSSGMVKTADWADWGKRFISVDFGEGAGVKGVPVEGVLRAFADRVFEAGGENEYYEKLQEKGIWLDGKKLNEMLFVKREIPVEVYIALVPLENHTYKKISDAEPHLETKSEEDYWRDRMHEPGMEPLREGEKQLEQFDKDAVMEKHIQETTENQNEPKRRPIYATKIIDWGKPNTSVEKPNRKKKKTEKEAVNDSESKKTDKTPSEEKTIAETIEEENEWLNTLNYEKPTVLILGKIFNFTLFSKGIMSKVIEAKNNSKSERNLTVQAACYEAIKQFKEEQCINLYHLLTIARYLRKSEEETSPPDEETEAIPDIYSTELEKIEELLKLLGVKYRKTQEGIEVREALEPYESIKIPKKNIEKIIKIKNNKHLTLQNLCDELNKMGLLINLEPFNLKNYLRRKSIPVDVYLGICYTLGIKKDVKLLTRWRKLNVEKAGKADGEWYNNYDIRVRIHPESLRNLYMELLNELEEKKISLDKFAVSLGEAGSTISRGSHLSEILDRKFVDTIALLEICNFLGRDPQTLRELDHNSLPLEETVSLPRKVIRLLRSETIKKYKQSTQLAKKINESPNNIKLYFLGSRGIPIEILKKIEKALDIEVKDSLYTRMKVGRRDYSREIIGEGGDEWEIMIEKIEIKEADGVKKPLLTFIHRRDKEGGSITTEVLQTGETAKSTPTPWWLSSPNTNITIDRTKEFKKSKDLLTYITEKCVNKAGTAWKLAKILDVPEDISERLLKDKENDTVTLRTLLALAMYSDEIKKLSELTNYVEKVGIIEKKHNPDLTIDWNNPEGAHIILNLHGDGGFQKKRKWAYTIYYSNSQIDFINAFTDNIEKVCGITPTINETRGQYTVFITSNLVGVALIRAGVKTGIKTRTNPKIPKWIIEGSTQMRKTATKAIIADEGNMAPKTPHLIITNHLDAPELERYRNTLNQIEGITRRTPTGTIYKIIDNFALFSSYKEILNIINTKQSNILQGVSDIIGSLLEEQGMKLEKKDLKITTQAILVYTHRISISKGLNLSAEATRNLHQILGGFPGYKELMYTNQTSVLRSIPKIPLRLSKNEVETLKKIGTQRIINGKMHYFVPIEKLPEELKQYANPLDGILKLQKEYFEEDVEILIDGNLIKVKGMPSRIRGEILLGPNENVALWRLVHALVEDIKKKWENVKNILNEEKRKTRKKLVDD